MTIGAALRTNRMCHALTGLSVDEFESLVEDFSWNYHEYEVRRRPDRMRKLGGGRSSYLKNEREKLFYALWYLKTYATFDLASFYIGFHRTKACDWAHILFPVLEQTMKRKLVLPQRKITTPEEFERLFPEVREVFADGIERSIQRNKIKKRQQKSYSGKKKMHTRKSVVIADKRRRILVITKQKSGRRHDKRLADKESLFESLPTDIDLYVDTGFVGVVKVHQKTYIPKKKSRRRPLTSDEKEMNTLISSYRVLIEHVIGGIKRYRCMSERLRNHTAFIDDQFILLSAGLWNYHLQFST